MCPEKEVNRKVKNLYGQTLIGFVDSTSKYVRFSVCNASIHARATAHR